MTKILVLLIIPWCWTPSNHWSAGKLLQEFKWKSSQSLSWSSIWYIVILNSHHSDVMMSVMVSQITGISIVYSTICSGVDQWKHQSSPVTGEFLSQHRDNSPATQTTPEPTLLSWGGWTRENPPPPHPWPHCKSGLIGWSPYEGPVMRKMFPFDDVIMLHCDCWHHIMNRHNMEKCLFFCW